MTDPVEPTPAEEPTGPKPGRGRRVVLAVLLGFALLLSCVGACVGAGVFYVYSASDMPVGAGDKAVLFQAADLAKASEWFEPVPGVGTIKKERYIDFACDLTYEYEDDDVYISQTVNWEPKHSDAAAGYLIESSAAGLLSDDKTTIKPRDDILKWGDRSRCFQLEYDGQPSGYLFVAKKGKLVVSLTLTGIVFEDPAVFRNMMAPKLKALSSYKP